MRNVYKNYIILALCAVIGFNAYSIDCITIFTPKNVVIATACVPALLATFVVGRNMCRFPNEQSLIDN